MNDKIHELAELCYRPHDGGMPYEMLDYEKFARLIILSCLYALDDLLAVSDEQHRWGVIESMDKIEQHFDLYKEDKEE